MASDGEISCTNDPNFAVIYSFLKVFGKLYSLEVPTLTKLQELIENTQEVLDPLKDLHLRLLRRALKSVQSNKWEKSLIKFCHQQAHHQEAWEIERFSYKKASTPVKLTILKLLLEYQFTCHPKFKSTVNAISCKELRLSPIGRDKNGCVYWLQVDHDANLCLYREDQDEESWQLIARNREEYVKIISQLKSGEDIKPSSASTNHEDYISSDIPQATESIEKIPRVDEENEEFLSPESESERDSDDQKQTELKVSEVDLQCVNDIKSKSPLHSEQGLGKITEHSKDFSEDIESKTNVKDIKISENENQEKDSNVNTQDPLKSNSSESPETGSESVSEAIEEPLMFITGEGNGAECESYYFVGEEIEEPVMYIFGDGWGEENNTGNPDTEEQVDDNKSNKTTSEECNGQSHDLANINSKKIVKSIKLRSSVKPVNKRTLKKQFEDNTDLIKSESKKHCIRDFDKSNGSNLNEQSDNRQCSGTDVKKKLHINKSKKKLRSKVKKKKMLQKKKQDIAKTITNSVSENEVSQNSKISIIEKRKSSLSSDHGDVDNTENEVDKISEKELQVVDDLPTKKLKLEDTVNSDNSVSNSKESFDETGECKAETHENNDLNAESISSSISKRKTIKARKGKLKPKGITKKENDEGIDTEVVVKKQSRPLKRTLLNANTSDKNIESQSESEEEEPKNSGKRLKVKPKKIITSSRKKVEAKHMIKSSSESEEETLKNLASRKSKKPSKKKTKSKTKGKGKLSKEQQSEESDTPVRQSRRIAQQKIKEEAERRHQEEIALRELKMIHKKKSKDDEEEWKASGPGSSSDGGARRGRGKRAGWHSDSSPEPESDSDEPLFYHEEPDPLENPKSDHEFSPESDLETGEPVEPIKRARTLQEAAAAAAEDATCKCCGSGEQPEWILLCDRCDAGYHASCLKPVLLIVPEGDWYCPPCNHEMLISILEQELTKYDELLASVEAERERKRIESEKEEPEAKEVEHVANEKTKEEKSEEDSESDSSSWSSSSAASAVYRLRARRQLPVSYRSQEYDRLISSAIKEEYIEPTTSAGNQGRGKDISTIIEAAEEEKLKAEREAIEQGKTVEIKKLKKKQRRKPRKLNSLEVPSEDDDETDEDFKDTGMESSSEEISTSAEKDSSNDSRSSDSLPIRRSCRPDRKDRQKIVESSPELKKKKKGVFEDSSSESAAQKEWTKKHRSKSKSKKRGKSSKKSRLTQYDAAGNVIRARVTYGGLSDDEPNDWSPKHRTRQRKINYTEMPNTESEDEMHKSSGKHMADSSDEFKMSEWDSSSGSERRRRRRSSSGERARALCHLVSKTAVVPLEKLPDHVTRAKTDELHAHLEAQTAANVQNCTVAASSTPRPIRGRGGRGGRGGRSTGRGRGGRGTGSPGSTGETPSGEGAGIPPADDALAKLVGVKIKDLKPDATPLKPNQAERDKKRQEREAKQAEKEARKMERLQKKEEKEKLKELKAKEREEKRLAKIALQESKRVKKEKPDFGMGPMGYGVPVRQMGPDRNFVNSSINRPPGDYSEQRFPSTPRLQVRPELRGIASAEDRIPLHRPDHPVAVMREGTLSVAGSPQPFKPAAEEPSVITRMPHMLAQQYRGQMMYSPGNPPYGPRGQGMQMYPIHHPGHPQNRHQYPPQYYSHIQGMAGYRPGGPPSSSSPNNGHQGAGPHGGIHGPHGPSGMHGPSPHGPPNIGQPGNVPQALIHRPQGQNSHGHVHPSQHATPVSMPHRPPVSSPHMPPSSSPHMAPGAMPYGPPGMRHMGPHGPPGSNPHGLPGPVLMRPSGPFPVRPDSHGPHGMHGPPGSTPHSQHMAQGITHGPVQPLGPPGMPHGPPPHTLGPQGNPLPRGSSPSMLSGPRVTVPPVPNLQNRIVPGSSGLPIEEPKPEQAPSPEKSSTEAGKDLPIKIKAEVKTEPEYQSPPVSPSHHPSSPEPLRNHPKIKRTENKDGRLRYPLGPYAPQYGPYGPYAPPNSQPQEPLLNLQSRLHQPPIHRMPPTVPQYLPTNLENKPGDRSTEVRTKVQDPERPLLQDMLRPRIPHNITRVHDQERPIMSEILRPIAPDRPVIQDLQKVQIPDRPVSHNIVRMPAPGTSSDDLPRNLVTTKTIIHDMSRSEMPMMHGGPRPDGPVLRDISGPDRVPLHNIPRPPASDRSPMNNASMVPVSVKPQLEDVRQKQERPLMHDWPRVPPADRPASNETARPPSSGDSVERSVSHSSGDPDRRTIHQLPESQSIVRSGIQDMQRAPITERLLGHNLPGHYPFIRPQIGQFPSIPLARQPDGSNPDLTPHFEQFQGYRSDKSPMPTTMRDSVLASTSVTIDPDDVESRKESVLEPPVDETEKEPSSPPDVKPEFLAVPQPVNNESEVKLATVKLENVDNASREEGSVFGGLVSYFSSQREDDLDT